MVLSQLIIGLVTAVGIGAPFADTPLSPQTDMEFQSTPAYQEVISQSYFTESGSCSDKDTYQTDGQSGTEHLLPNTALQITYTITSGVVVAVNQSLQNGVCARTLTIRAMEVSQPTFYTDTWTFTDIQGSPVVNDGYKVSQNGVLVKPPSTGGPGGGGGGS